MGDICRVDELNGYIGNGCTDPMTAMLMVKQDQFIGVVKLKNNAQTVLSIVNEWISYNLACNLKILMPESGIAIVDGNTKLFEDGVVTKEDYGSCFYSRYVEKAVPLNYSIMKYIKNKDAYEKVILFDHLIYNTDRNIGNMLFKHGKSGKLMYMIDHTHVFKNATIWDRHCLRHGIKDNDYKDELILETNTGIYDLFFSDKIITEESLKEQAHVFQNTMDREMLNVIIQSIPKDWNVDESDLNVLTEYLLYRNDHLIDMCEMIMSFKERR